MTEVSIRLASTDAEVEQVRDLCLQWLDWHWKNYPADWPKDGNPMDPERFKTIVADLPTLHARPDGAMFLALLDGQPVGCVMYNRAGPDIAEFNRMFVSDDGRGHGIGRRLLDHMFDQMTRDGYQRVMFSSAKFLTHAKAMYTAAGFVDIPHPDGFPAEWQQYVYFMERPLSA